MRRAKGAWRGARLTWASGGGSCRPWWSGCSQERRQAAASSAGKEARRLRAARRGSAGGLAPPRPQAPLSSALSNLTGAPGQRAKCPGQRGPREPREPETHRELACSSGASAGVWQNFSLPTQDPAALALPRPPSLQQETAAPWRCSPLRSGRPGHAPAQASQDAQASDDLSGLFACLLVQRWVRSQNSALLGLPLIQPFLGLSRVGFQILF